MPGPDQTDKKNAILDLLVIGLGPAGVACALQAHRDGLALLAVGDEPVGGLVPAARRLDNLPAQPGVNGRALAEAMAEQVDERGVPTTEGEVVDLSWEQAGRHFQARLRDGRTFFARATCLATGTRPRPWRVPIEGARWIHRDARSLPQALDDLQVIIVGGGEAALDTALTARDRGATVELLVRGDRLRSASGLVSEAEASSVAIRFGVDLARARRREDGWHLETTGGDSHTADELVVCIGREPRDELIEGLRPGGYPRAVVQPERPGLFLAGDAIRGRERYVATALGDGQRAAIAATKYLKEG